MHLLKELILGVVYCSLAACSGDTDDNKAELPKDEAAIDTIDYRALVYVDEPSLNQRYGGEKKFNQNLQTLFYNTTRFWNNSGNKFKYYFRFVPAGLKVYPHVDGEKYEEAAKEAGGPLDARLYDYVVFFCLASPNNTMSCGGSSDGHAVIWCTKTLETQQKDGNIFEDGLYPTKLGTYSNLGHEAGHFRGATDLYQYGIKSANNPINGEKFNAQPCNMGTGTWVWSDYASAVFNYTAKYKRLPSDWSEQRFPRSIEIAVKKGGQPVPNATVKLYGCRGGGGEKGLPSGDNGPDVYKEPFRTFTADKDGKILINDAYRLYQVRTDGSEILPDPLPWAYWFNFLVEATDQNGAKAYIWMPDLDIQRQHLEENTLIYKTEIKYE